jgi:hypothetical protein
MSERQLGLEVAVSQPVRGATDEQVRSRGEGGLSRIDNGTADADEIGCARRREHGIGENIFRPHPNAE